MKMDRVAPDQLHRAWQEAFSGYAVDMSYMTEERIRARAVKNNVDFDLSVAAYDGDRMVGFTLIAVDDWLGERAAFDAATGIVPGFRGRGLAQRMFNHAAPGLRARGVTRFLLEVIRSNEAAIRAYRKTGFEVTREFDCFEIDVASLAPAPRGAGSFDIRPLERDALVPLEEQVDWQPSWENGFPAIRRIPDDLLIFGAHEGGTCTGAVVYTPLFNWIMTLIVARPHRRRGIGSALLRHLADRLPAGVTAMSLLNVDRSDKGMPAFLARRGFRHTIGQYEMSRRI